MNPKLKSRQLPPEENCPLVRVRVWVKLRVSFKVVSNQTIAPEKNCSPPLLLGLMFALGLVLELVGDNFPPAQLS